MLDVNVVIDNKIFNDIIIFFRSIFKKENVISNYFKSDVLDNHSIDFFFYQLGLRKNLPIMDWLYLEYIKFLNKNSKIKKLIIFPTIDTPEAHQAESDFNIFCENVKKIFKDSGIEIEFIDPLQDDYFDKKDLVSKDFIEALNYIGSKKFFKSLNESPFHIKITSISDFNKPRPKDDKIKNIFIHIHKSWSIVNYIKKKISLNESVNVSAIFWKWQIDKLGVIKHYLFEKNVNFYSVLGETQNIEPIEDDPICIFDSNRSIIEKAIKSTNYLKKYNLLLESGVLSNKKDFNRERIISNGERQWNSYLFSVNNDAPKIRNKTHFFQFLGLIDEIRSLYENENT